MHSFSQREANLISLSMHILFSLWPLDFMHSLLENQTIKYFSDPYILKRILSFETADELRVALMSEIHQFYEDKIALGL